MFRNPYESKEYRQAKKARRKERKAAKKKRTKAQCGQREGRLVCRLPKNHFGRKHRYT